jgi:HK97 family phage portal protein
MKIWPWGSGRAIEGKAGVSLDQLIARLDAAWATASGVAVTPETCMQSPTVLAIVTAISRRISTLPIQVIRKHVIAGRDRKELLPNHPVAKLLAYPNDWQDPNQFWLDATSQLVRYGNFFAHKSRGTTGPIRALLPINSGGVSIRQETDWSILYEYTIAGGDYQRLPPDRIMHARGPARDFLKGDSPVQDIREAIGLEIMAEKMGASVFGNSAMPSIIFKFADGAQGFKTEEERSKFVESFQAVYANKGRFTAALLPKGIEVDDASGIDNEKAQYTATRQYQRTVIAAAFGVPVHMVGDLSKGTFNNVEQQTLDFVMNVVLPYARMFECAMERSLLTDSDRTSGVIIRFNLDAIIRGDFKSRQEGLNIQRQAGVISANDWRERENLNPISEDDGGDEYWRKGPSGQDAAPPGGAPQPPAPIDSTNATPTQPPEGDDPNAD